MSKYGNIPTTAPPKLEPEITWETWDEPVMNLIQQFTPHCHGCLRTGRQPNFQVPSKTYPVKVARKPGLVNPSPEDLALPEQRWTSNIPITSTTNTASTPTARTVPLPPPPPHTPVARSSTAAAQPTPTLYDREDQYFYYKDVVRPEYDFVGADEYLKSLTNAIVNRQAKYMMEERSTCWSILERHMGMKVLQQLKTPAGVYEQKLADLDYVWLYTRAKFLHSGEGAHSVFLKNMKLNKLEMLNDDWVTYITEFSRIRKEIEDMNIPPADLVRIMFDTKFQVGLMHPSSHCWDIPNQQVIQLDKWPTMDETINKMQTALTAKAGIEKYNSGGVIEANAASTSKSTSSMRNNYSATPKKPTAKAGTPHSAYDHRCLRCGKEGHIAKNCTTQLSPEERTCDKCGGPHHSSMHTLYQAVEKAKSAGKKSSKKSNRSSKRSFSKSKDAAKIKAAYNAILTDDDTYDEYAEQIEYLEANEAECDFEDEDDEDDTYDAVADEFNISGYVTDLVYIENHNVLIESDIDILLSQVECLNVNVEADTQQEADNEPITGYIDSACNEHLLNIRHLYHVDITDVKPISGVGVQGIDKKVPPLVVTHTGKHKVIGRVFFGKFSRNLFGVARLFSEGFTMSGERDHISMSRKGKTVFTGRRDANNLFAATLPQSTKESDTIEANMADSELRYNPDLDYEDNDEYHDHDFQNEMYESYIDEFNGDYEA